MKNILFISLCLISFFFRAQNPLFQWVKHFQGASFPNYAQGRSINTDLNGNIYTVGFFEGTADFDPGTNTNYLTPIGYSDVFISKMDAQGNVIWVKIFGGWAHDMAYSSTLDNFGNIYITGSFYGTADFDPGPGEFNLTASSGYFDSFIAKFDSSGGLLWAKSFDGPNDEWGHSIVVDSHKNVYSIGLFYNTVDFDPGPGIYQLSPTSSVNTYISKLDSLGNFVFAKKIDGISGGYSGDGGKYLSIDSLNNIYLTGYYSGVSDFDPSSSTYTLSSAGNSDVFVLKLNSSGSFLWVKSIGSNLVDRSASVATDRFGNVYTIGYFQGTVDFDPGSSIFPITSKGAFDTFILKLDINGNFKWSKSIGNIKDNYAFAMNADMDGNVYYSGIFVDTVDFDPGPASYTLIAYPGNGTTTDLFISKIDSSGNFDWAKQISGPANEKINSIHVTSNFDVYSTGSFANNVDFDPEINTYNLQAFGENVFIHKMAGCCVGLIENLENTNLGIYPNPVHNNLILNNNNKYSFELLTIRIIDLAGKIVKEEMLNFDLNKEINVSELQPGFYILNVNSKGNSYKVKFIKE